jgi:hypothetical protein
MNFLLRLNYGSITPWTSRARLDPGGETLLAMAGPDAWALHGMQLPEAQDQGHIGEFAVSAGEKVTSI